MAAAGVGKGAAPLLQLRVLLDQLTPDWREATDDPFAAVKAIADEKTRGWAEAADLRAKLAAMTAERDQARNRVDEVETREGEMVATLRLKERDLADFKRGTGFPNDADIVHLCRGGETFKDALRRMAAERDQARQACEIWSGRLAEAERALKAERDGHTITAKARVQAEQEAAHLRGENQRMRVGVHPDFPLRVRLTSNAAIECPESAGRFGSVVGLRQDWLEVLFDSKSKVECWSPSKLRVVRNSAHPENFIPLPMGRGPTIDIRITTSRSFFAFDPRSFTVTLERRTS